MPSLLSEDQQMLHGNFAELGAFSIRVPEASGGLYAGTSEVHRSLIAERTLRLPRTRA